MKKLTLLHGMSIALLMVPCLGRADVITFDNPAQIVIDNTTGIATYTEDGYAFAGPAASFLPLDSALLGNSDLSGSPLVLTAVGGTPFSLTALDESFYDLGVTGALTVLGMNGMTVVGTQVINLGSPMTLAFGSKFGNVTSISFTSTAGYEIDNLHVNSVASIPEPSTWAMGLAGIAAIALRLRRRTRPTVSVQGVPAIGA